MEDIELNYEDYSLVIPRKNDIKKAYLEITNECNLNCKMCFRRFWDDTLGKMSFKQFQVIFKQLREFPSLKTVFLGGIGEPTIHPDFANIVKIIKEAGYRLEFGTNGTKLAKYADSLVKYGVDKIMVSIDSADPTTYKDIRGTDLFGIEDNIMAIQEKKKDLRKNYPEMGIEVVMMKSNINQLFDILKLANRLNINYILFSNVIPFDESLKNEIVYDGSIDYEKLVDNLNNVIGKYNVNLEFPKFDLQTERICQFIQNKSTVIRWDGEVAPCYRFLHNYSEFIFGREKKVIAHSFGNVFKEKLSDIWNSKSYAVFRYNVKNAIYPSCTDCSLRYDCSFTDDTEYDCWGNSPSCADCLWARGITKCP
ncbi:MAG: tungsten cofactor oxidoreductase radical SAM maturase [Desulfatiglandales bacterium]